MRASLVALVVGLTMLSGLPANAEYPSRVVRVIVPTSAGGTTDLLARMLAAYIGAKTGEQVVVENRPGANGNIGMDAVAKSAPDGYTLGFANTGNIVINPFLYKNVPFDPLKDLTPVGLVGDAPQLLVINKDVPARTFQELVALVKSKPGEFNYGSAGIGSTPHLAGDQLARMVGLEMVHVPYRGTSPAITDLVRGALQMISISYGPVAGFVESGALRVLLAAGKKRSAILPDIPTAAEAGIDYDMSTWFGLFAPAGTPKEIIVQLNGWITGMLADAAVQKRLMDNSVEQVVMSPEEFARFVAAEAVKWERAVRQAGLLDK